MQETGEQISESDIKKLSEEMHLRALVLSDRIYLEMGLLMDITLGCVFSEIFQRPVDVAKPQYEYVVENHVRWAEKRYHDVEFYLPGCGVSNARIAEILADPRTHYGVFRAAPPTGFIQILREQIMVNNNHSATVGKRDAIRVVVNTYPLRLADQDLQEYGSRLAHYFGIEIEFAYIDPGKLTLRELSLFDEFYVHNFQRFLENPVFQKQLEELHFREKHLFAALFFGDVHPKDTKSDDWYTGQAQLVWSRLSFYTLFKYISPATVSAAYPSAVTEEAGPQK